MNLLFNFHLVVYSQITRVDTAERTVALDELVAFALELDVSGTIALCSEFVALYIEIYITGSVYL